MHPLLSLSQVLAGKQGPHPRRAAKRPWLPGPPPAPRPPPRPSAPKPVRKCFCALWARGPDPRLPPQGEAQIELFPWENDALNGRAPDPPRN